MVVFLVFICEWVVVFYYICDCRCFFCGVFIFFCNKKLFIEFCGVGVSLGSGYGFDEVLVVGDWVIVFY